MSKNLTILMLVSGFYGQAQDPLYLKDTTYLDDVVISANRSARSLDEVDRSVSIIGQDKIEKLPYQNVAELLGQESGLFIIGQGQNPGSNQSLFLRGANSDQVTILIDGVRITDPSTPGGSLDLSELSLVNVKRIEILRGSHATMYGTSGIGGVINIITNKDQPGWKLTGQLQGGIFDARGRSLKNAITGRYQLENGLYASGGYEHWQVNGLDASADTATAGYHTADRDNFQKTDYYGQLGYASGGVALNVFYKSIHQRADLDQGAFDDDDNYFLEFDRNLLNYQAGYDFSKWALQFQGGYSDMGRRTENDSSIVDEADHFDGQFSSSDNSGMTLTNEVQGVFGKNGRVNLLAGAGHYQEKMNLKSYYYSSAFGGFELVSDLDSLGIHSSSYYAFSQLILGGPLLSESLKDLQLTLGGRLTRHSRFGLQESFELSTGYDLPKGNIFLSVSSGFRNPSLTQLFDPTFTPGNATSRGNKELEPEESVSYEIGWNHRFGGLKTNVSVFQTRITNVIEYIYLWDASAETIGELDFSDYRGDTYINLSRLSTKGIELGFDWKLSDRLNLVANYSLIDGAISFSPEEVDAHFDDNLYIQLFTNGQFLDKRIRGDQLVRRPSNLVNSRVAYQPADPIRLSLSYRYVDSRADSFYDATLGPFGALNTLTVPGYHLFDFYALYEIRSTWNLGFRIENIFNTDYREIQGFNTRGRGFYLKIGYSISGK